MKKVVAAAVMFALLTSPAFAPPRGSATNEVLQKQDEDAKKRQKQLDKEYNETMKRTRGAAPAYDPWGGVRPSAGDKK